MKERLRRLLLARAPWVWERYQERRDRGESRWRAGFSLAGEALLALAGLSRDSHGKKPLPREGESRGSLREPPQELAQKLAAFDVVCFDIFDTLLLRTVDRPEDVFYFLGARCSYLDLKRLRVEGERRAREEKQRAAGTGEVTLEEIWSQVERDTALPRREGAAWEQDLERAVCRANPYFLPVVNALRRMGKPLCLVSDMYLPGEFLRQVLEDVGFGRFSCCLISGEEGVSKGEGKLFARLRGRFPPGTTFAHVGDHPVSDGIQARKQGVTPFLVPRVRQRGGPYRARDLSPVVGSVYRALVNNRLHNGSQAFSPLYEFGFVYGGLFVLGYCRFLREYSQRRQADKLLFLSRDGALLETIYRRLYPEDPRPVYAYWSRLAAAKVTAGLFPADFFRRFLRHKADGRRMEEVFRSMELLPLLEPLEAEGIFPQTPLTHKNLAQVEGYLRKRWDQVLAFYQGQREAAGRYYRQLLGGSLRAAAVDIGWAGSGAVSLAWAAERLWKLPCSLTGVVAGTNSRQSPEWDAAEPLLLTGKLSSYLFSAAHNRDLWKFHNPAAGHNLFWELLLGGEEGSLRGFYPGEEGGFRLEFSPNPHKEAVREVHRGVKDFVEEFRQVEKRLGRILPISGRDAYAPMLEFLEERNAPFRRNLEVFLDGPEVG